MIGLSALYRHGEKNIAYKIVYFMQRHERICETKDDKLLMSLQVELFCILILRNVMTTYTGFIVTYSTFFMDGQTYLIKSKGENHRFTNSTAPRVSISTFDSILRHFVRVFKSVDFIHRWQNHYFVLT